MTDTGAMTVPTLDEPALPGRAWPTDPLGEPSVLGATR